MQPQQAGSRTLDAVAQKWRRLAEQRRAHFVELFHSGRWKRYYTEEQYLERMREAIRLAERWAMIAPPPPEEIAPAIAPVVFEPQRDAA
jgi:uncharacterized repeat protein (TIGR03809 family)